MIRFVAISSMCRGAIEPAEVLADGHQTAAAVCWERDESDPGERVFWRDGEPYVAVGRPPESSRLPKVSAGLRAQLCGAPIVIID
jgi:hypothetical protein